jgi:hypothetical protein
MGTEWRKQNQNKPENPEKRVVEHHPTEELFCRRWCPKSYLSPSVSPVNVLGALSRFVSFHSF